MKIFNLIKFLSLKSINYYLFRAYKFYVSSIIDTPKRAFFSFFDRRKIRKDFFVNNLFKDVHFDSIAYDKRILDYKNYMNLNRFFDLLGSGWVQNYYDSRAIGFNNHFYDNNINCNKNNIIKKIVPRSYVNKSSWIYNQIEFSTNINNSIYSYRPIDWQKDFKSGYRFNSKKWYKLQRKDIPIGVDIKVPWELARLQHLPQLAVFAIENQENKTQNLLEFKNQCLDFISTNPIRYGVNWHCTMDVAIRGVNLLLGFDLFKSIDKDNILDEGFSEIIFSSLYEHLKFIYNNLEWNFGKTNNHYLSNIAGLIIISSYLNSSNKKINNKINSIYNFSKKHFFNEVKKQFNKDGGNFENSSSYHKLSTEIILWTTAILSRNGEFNEQNKTIDDYKIKFNKIYQFSKSILFNDGNAPQFGDNDSGRFINITPIGEKVEYEKIISLYQNLENYKAPPSLYENYFKKNKWFDEDNLSHSSLISIFENILDTKEMTFNQNFESELINQLVQKKFSMNKQKISIQLSKPLLNNSTFEKTIDFTDDNIQDLREGVYFNFFPHSGYYLIKSPKIYLCIFCGNSNQNTFYGHSHNDRLSVELVLNGNNHALKDPGSYIYTSDIKMRNFFRNISVHNTVNFYNNSKIIQMLDWFPGVKGAFSLMGKVDTALISYEDLKLDTNGNPSNNPQITLECYYKNFIHQRQIIIFNDSIKIIDRSNQDFNFRPNNYDFYSNGYGKLIKT